jgi:hypothetical protein
MKMDKLRLWALLIVILPVLCQSPPSQVKTGGRMVLVALFYYVFLVYLGDQRGILQFIILDQFFPIVVKLNKNRNKIKLGDEDLKRN